MRLRVRFSEQKLAYLFILPALITLSLIALYPMFFAINLSLRTWILYRPQLGKPFIGLENYITIICSAEFWSALRVTMIFVAVSTSLTLLIGLTEALLVNEMKEGRGIVSSLLILPLVVTPVVVAFGWRFTYNEHTGLIAAYFLPLLGIHVRTILGDPAIALYGLIAADVWNQTPFAFLIFLAGIQSLPEEPYEAAKIDGASPLQIFRYITLPLLKPVVLIVLILRTMDTFKIFDLPWIMTSGGPGTATRNLVIAGYDTAFIGYRMGRASAYGIIILYVIFALALIYIRYMVGKRK